MSNIGKRLLIIVMLLAAFSTGLLGCSPAELDSKLWNEYVTAKMKLDRHRVDVFLQFRTTIVVELTQVNENVARSAQNDLVKFSIEYFQRDKIFSYMNDTLVFITRLEDDPSVNIKYSATKEDALSATKGEYTLGQFIERCTKEENWLEVNWDLEL